MKITEISTWTLQRDGFPACEGKVPCSLYSVLFDNRLIPDPFDIDNEYALTPLSRQGCDFISRFTWQTRTEHLCARFLGLDTLATVYVNGILVGNADNMHRTWEFDLLPCAVLGENEIRVHFASPVEYMERKQDEHYVFGDGNSGRGIAHLRKSLCMSGWDWAPNLPDMGFYRPVEIVSWNGARIEDVLLHQEHTKNAVRVTASLTLSEPASGLAKLTLRSPDGEVQEAVFADGVASISVKNPQLWWPNGLGDQPLYDVKVTWEQDGKENDVWARRIGLRTMEVSRQKDDPKDQTSGEEFCFVCNGVKFFAMGADYVPEDSLLSRLSRARTEKLLRGCVEAHHNCVRVWGGAFYPHDDFYDLCDELGLVVWQDFMFACMNVWMTEAFTANVRQEAVDNVRRLRHHASLGLFCGNNEMEVATVEKWDINPNTDWNEVKADYLFLYEKLLPELCGTYCPDTFYWPASPSSGGGFDDPNSDKRGDVHYWGAWHGSIPFESYRQYKFRFLSEFGFEAFPNIKTIRSFTREKDRNPFSFVMESHQKCKGGNTKILTYLSDKYLYPTTFEKLVYTSQLLQADAIRYGVEHFRRYRGTCMGAVYWQLNDCWPVASWSSVDYFGRWKALQYASKRFFAPTLLSVHENGTTVTANVSHEKREPFFGNVTLRLQTADFTVLDEKRYSVTLPAMFSLDVATVDYADLLFGKEKDAYLSYVLTDADGKTVSSGSLLFTKPKYFRFENPNVDVLIEGEDGEFLLTVRAKAYARSVELNFSQADVHLSDNYFDLTDGKPYTVRGFSENKKLTKEDLKRQLTVQSVYSLSEF